MVSSEARAVVIAEAIEDLGFEWVRERLGELFLVRKAVLSTTFAAAKNWHSDEKGQRIQKDF